MAHVGDVSVRREGEEKYQGFVRKINQIVFQVVCF